MGFDSVGVAWVERLRLLPPVGPVGAALAGVDLFHRVGCFQAAAATECGLLVR